MLEEKTVLKTGIKELPNEKTQLIISNKVSEDEKKNRYPASVFYIVGTEFCERFCFYGMRTILILYLTSILLYNEDTATVIYHCFVMGCYFTPLLGATLSDSFIGKFRTILYISVLYACGNVILSLAAIPNLLPMSPLSMLGLSLIALGAGGIKPCVAAFGGDQFNSMQVRQLQAFFSLFYMTINVGSVVSTFVTPVLREDVKCFHSDSCYPLAFGVPAILMIISLCLFVMGYSKYTIVPSTGNITAKTAGCIVHALGVKKSSDKKLPKKEHWLDYAEGKYEANFLKDVKALLHVLFLYLPLPMFYAVYDQQGSRWILQATRMDGRLPWFTIKPDQIHILNPILIITLVPLFEFVVYPVFEKCHFLERPLQKMIAGGLLTASGFILAGILQVYIEQLSPVLPPPGYSSMSLINGASCPITITSSLFNTTLSVDEMHLIKDIRFAQTYEMVLSPQKCIKSKNPVSYHFNSSNTFGSMLISDVNDQVGVQKIQDSLKVLNEEASILIFLNIPSCFIISSLSRISLIGKEKNYNLSLLNHTSDYLCSTGYHHIKPGRYQIMSYFTNCKPLIGSFEAKPDGRYIFIITLEGHCLKLWAKYVVNEPKSISMLLQLPQYAIVTVGEILFSVTGLKFAYSQAPESMKSVVQAAWLLTNGVGDLIIVLVAQFRFFEKQSNEFFLFSGLLILDMLVFAIMAYFYKYADFTNRMPTTPTYSVEKEIKDVKSLPRSR